MSVLAFLTTACQPETPPVAPPAPSVTATPAEAPPVSQAPVTTPPPAVPSTTPSTPAPPPAPSTAPSTPAPKPSRTAAPTTHEPPAPTKAPPTSEAPQKAAGSCGHHTVGSCGWDAGLTPVSDSEMAQCKDGTPSFSATPSGTCSKHGGVEYWFK
ncbi:DUF3761 domain-containing protein [Kitasatospora sp. McL0602]|uniref:DUF3761 domain-containing protein n=1 Tax=Kitasatospora sp. McL0602 TaxID=3439530 RepID=UPI003F8A003A